jgi:hypothetical protein
VYGLGVDVSLPLPLFRAEGVEEEFARASDADERDSLILMGGMTVREL